VNSGGTRVRVVSCAAAVSGFVDRPPEDMSRYLAGRVLAGLVTLFLFVTILFFMAEWLIPMREEAGEPSAGEQYVDFLGGLVGGDFLRSAAVGSLPWTLIIFIFAIGLAFPVGHWLGKVAGWRTGEKGSAGLTIGAVLMYTVFPPLLVFVLIMVVSRFTNDQGIGFLRTLYNEGGLIPGVAWSMLVTITLVAIGAGLLALVASRLNKTVPGPVWVVILIGIPLLVWVGRGMADEVTDILVYLGLPIIAVAILVAGDVMLVSKATTAEAAQEDFVFTAEAKGVPDRRIRDHHVARYALLPMLSKLMVSVPFILVGLMIVEISFSWPKYGVEQQGTALGTFGMFVPGMSSTVFTSLENRDPATVVDGLIVVGLVVLAFRLIIEVLHAVLDPRIRIGGRDR
jgi:peptide/nickel transport system permease protein